MVEYKVTIWALWKAWDNPSHVERKVKSISEEWMKIFLYEKEGHFISET